MKRFGILFVVFVALTLAIPTLKGLLAVGAEPSSMDVGKITIDYPKNGSIFPPEFPPPPFEWRDSEQIVDLWRIQITF